MTRRGFAAVLTSAAGLGLAGCNPARLIQGEPPQLYTLTPKSTFDPDLPTAEWQLLIEPPVAAAGIDTTRIALRNSLTTLDYYAGVQWTARAPEMVQTLMVESFENSDRIVSIGRESIGLRADYVLKTELREFQVENASAAAPSVRVGINAKLVRIPQRSIIAGRDFEEVVQAPSSQFDAIILAFDEALGSVLKELVEWTLRTGEADWVARS